jgi:hypothetical protein
VPNGGLPRPDSGADPKEAEGGMHPIKDLHVRVQGAPVLLGDGRSRSQGKSGDRGS